MFVFTTTGFCVAVPAAMAFLGIDTPLAEMVARGLLGIAQIAVVTYLGASVIDRSRVLDKLGDAAVRGKG